MRSGFFAGLYLLGTCWLAMRWVLRPLRQLAGALRHIENGRYRPWMQAPPGPLRELRVLHRGLHALWEGLERRGRARDAALEELSRREQGYRGLFEANPNIMWITDVETLAFLAVNDAAVAHYGYSRHEFLSMRVTDLLPPEDRAELEETAGEASDDAPGPRYLRSVPRIWRHVTRPGRTLLVEVERHELEFASRPARLFAGDGRDAAAGQRVAPARAPGRRQRAARAAWRELTSARSVVSGMSHLSLEGDGLQPMLRRLQRLTHVPELPFAPEAVDLTSIAEREVHLLRLGEPSRRVHVEVQPGLVCRGDAPLARQVLHELLAQRVELHAQPAERVDPRGPGARPGTAPSSSRTTAIGFDAAVQARLYLPFERLHSPADYPGDGLGLAIAAAAVQRHHGRLWACSQPGQGASFFFTLAAPGPAHERGQVSELMIDEAVPQD